MPFRIPERVFIHARGELTVLAQVFPKLLARKSPERMGRRFMIAALCRIRIMIRRLIFEEHVEWFNDWLARLYTLL